MKIWLSNNFNFVFHKNIQILMFTKTKQIE